MQKLVKDIKVDFGTINSESNIMEFYNNVDDMKCQVHTSNRSICDEELTYDVFVNKEDRQFIIDYINNDEFHDFIENNKNEQNNNISSLSIIVKYEDDTSFNADIEDIYSTPFIIKNFYNKIKELREKYEKEFVEKTLIELAIYDAIATNPDDNAINEMQRCSEILNYELGLSEDGDTIFKVSVEDHIVTKLRKKLNNIDKKIGKYQKYVKSALLKLNYFISTDKSYHLMNLAADEDVDQLTDEIFYFGESLDELKKEPITNIDAMNELCNRYYYAKIDKEAFELSKLIYGKGHKKADFTYIMCLYYGYGTEKDEKEAFKEIQKFVNNKLYSKARELLGEMYYYGRGTEQDYKNAFECFEDCEHIESSAQYHLGLMYINGYGVKKDETKGLNYIMKSAKNRYKKAIEYIINYGIDEEFNKYCKLYEEKFGKRAYIAAPSGTKQKTIEAIKVCLEKNEDLLDKLLYPNFDDDMKNGVLY